MNNHQFSTRESSRLVTQGTLLKIVCPVPSDVKASLSAQNRGQKGKLTSFTKKARLNFARALSATNWPVQPSHVSLTYGGALSERQQIYGKTFEKARQLYFKQDLERLQDWMSRNGVQGFWRLEFQERKQACLEYLSGLPSVSPIAIRYYKQCQRAAHFHLLVIGLTQKKSDALRKFWGKISGNTHSRAYKVTEREAGRASWYLALHAQKGNQAPDIPVGRWWGYFNEKAVKALQVETDLGELSDKTEFRLRRIQRKLLSVSHGYKKKAARKRQSTTVFMSEHTQKRIVAHLLEREQQDNLCSDHWVFDSNMKRIDLPF